MDEFAVLAMTGKLKFWKDNWMSFRDFANRVKRVEQKPRDLVLFR